jgi:hypothetical protein
VAAEYRVSGDFGSAVHTGGEIVDS